MMKGFSFEGHFTIQTAIVFFNFLKLKKAKGFGGWGKCDGVSLV
jgi:hypothetical protein